MSLKMPFGKFRGVLIADLPNDYLAWLTTLHNLRDPLRSAVATEWGARQSLEDTVKPLSSEVQQMAAEIVSTGYRKLAQVHHPDHGGEGQTMTLLNLAAEFLRAVVRAR